MKLAKEVVNFGLYTEQREAICSFWQEAVGLPFEETLRAGGGVHQLRHGMNGSVMKINHNRDSLPKAGPSGYRELWIARAGLDDERELVDPDGNRIRLLPIGARGVDGIGLQLAVRDEASQHRFYADVLGLEPCGDRRYRIGSSVLSFEGDPDIPADSARNLNRQMRAPGFRYMTIQVPRVDEAHREVVARGGWDGVPPRTLG